MAHDDDCLRDSYVHEDEAATLFEELQRAVDEHGRILARQSVLIQMLREELQEVKGDRPRRR